MFFRIPKRLRAAAALVAVAAYALPLAIGLLADAGHVAQHVRSAVQEQRRVAAAFGLAHLSDAPPPVSAHAGFVHTHGGSTHTHDHATAALLRAAEHADETSGPAHAPVLELAGHLPGLPEGAGFAAAAEAAVVSGETTVPSSFFDSPLLPPPRA
jgi:hypothetical protein